MKTTLKIFNLIVNTNYFTFDTNIYKQSNETSVIFPISGLLADFMLQLIETDIYKLDYTLHTWIRYVDDILRTDTLLDNFLTQINSLDYKIRFTLEIEQNRTVPYLDVLLIKTHQEIERTAYRKYIVN